MASVGPVEGTAKAGRSSTSGKNAGTAAWSPWPVSPGGRTAIDEFTRLLFLASYPEQSTYSFADFLKKLVKRFARRGIRVECVRTDNGFEFTNRFSNSKRDIPTRLEATSAKLGTKRKLIRSYTPRHNGKVERSHWEDQKRFYSCHSFYSLDDFASSSPSTTAAPTTSP